MEKWQLAGIISTDSRRELTLPGRVNRKSSLTSQLPSGGGTFFKFIQTTLRKMTEVVALF